MGAWAAPMTPDRIASRFKVRIPLYESIRTSYYPPKHLRQKFFFQKSNVALSYALWVSSFGRRWYGIIPRVTSILPEFHFLAWLDSFDLIADFFKQNWHA